MNKYNLSALSKKGRADIFNEAEKDGVIIQDCNTNGDVRRELVLQLRTPLTEFSNAMTKHFENDSTLWNEDIINGEHPKYKFDHIKKALKALKEIKGDL